MTEYVKRDLLIQLFNDAYDRLQERIDWAAENEMWSLRHGYKVCRTQLEEDIYIVKSVDAADVRPVVRGEWKTAWLDHEAFGERPKVLYCSACNQVATIRTPFCPHCGADMRKEDGHDGNL